MATAAYFIGMQIRMRREATSNDVNLPGLATTEALTRHVNLITFPKLCRGTAKSGWRMTIPGGSRATRKLSFVGRISIDKRACIDCSGQLRVVGYPIAVLRLPFRRFVDTKIDRSV